MRKLRVIGIGAGDPDHITLQAVRALNEADVLFIPCKGAEKDDLRQQRLAICDRHIAPGRSRIVEFDVPQRASAGSQYQAVVRDWHDQIAGIYATLIERELGAAQVGAFLVWGDPSLYDSTLRIIETAKRRCGVPFDHDVIPGITSVQALAARHRIPLNRIGEPIGITTGRRLAARDRNGAVDLIVMLDGEQAFANLPDEDTYEIFWGAYLGTADEILIAGPLAEVKSRIEAVRAEARRAKGWIMDTYLLRRRS